MHSASNLLKEAGNSRLGFPTEKEMGFGGIFVWKNISLSILLLVPFILGISY